MEEKRKLSSEKVKAEALRLGFSACGMARAEMVDKSTAGFFRQWLSQGNHAEMHYMENHLEKRLDPRQLLEGAKTVVCVDCGKEFQTSAKNQKSKRCFECQTIVNREKKRIWKQKNA